MTQFRLMPRVRRVVALMQSLLLAHLVWVGSGFACAMPAVAASDSSVEGARAGTMAGMVGMTASTVASTMDTDAPPPAGDPCGFPWAPDGCVAIAPCSPIAVATISRVMRVPDRLSTRVAALDVLRPSSWESAPEFPPPKA